MYQNFFVVLLLLTTASAYAQNLGDSDFFVQVEASMQANSSSSYVLKYSNDATVIIFDADGYKMDVYTTAISGNTIVDAVAANSDAEFIINGSLFNSGSNEQTGPFYFPTGQVVKNGAIISDTSGSTPSDDLAILRYWIGQTKDTSSAKNAGSAASYVFGGKGHPNGVGTGPNDIYTAHGGLLSLIWEKGGSPHKQTAKDDQDLDTYLSFMPGRIIGYGVIAVDRETGLLALAVKNNLSYGNIKGLQDKLFESGADRALMVDGGGSIGVYVKSHNFYIKASNRHGNPDRMDTVPSYIMFKKND